MVWSVPQLPDVGNDFISTYEYNQMTNIRVSSLMTVSRKRWDVELLYDVFCTKDADLIKRMPIHITDSMDLWYWLLDEKGDFTVKSCYRWV